MSTENERIARGTYDALMRGELDVVAELLAPEVTWQWWEPGPWDCHNRDEVVAVIRERAGQRAIGDLIEVSEVVPGKVLIVSGRRPDSEISAEDLGLPPGHDETAHLVTFRAGKVVAMHDYRTREEAMQALVGAEHRD